MAEWKKVVVSGSNISQLNNDLGFVSSIGSGIVSGSSQISFTGITNVPSGLVSGSSQISFTGITNVPSGLVSGSSQVDFTNISNIPSGLVSGSVQILLGGDLSGTADSVTVAKVQGVALTSGEATQLANIGSTTISATQWGYLGAMDQNISSTDNVTFSTVNTGQGENELYAMDQAVRTTDSVTFATASVSQNLSVGGDLIVQGDLTYINTANTLVEDQFILLGSGSAEGSDIGIIFDGVGGTTGAGAAFFFDGGVSRLSYATTVAHNATSVTPAAYIPLVFDVTGASHTPDTNVGNIKIESGEAYIYV